jgi:sigma-B regulation protein RsbU (phosphoserine phosphatase)
MILLKLSRDGRIEYVNCGHVQPLSILGKEIRRLEEGNLIVGLIASASYTSARCLLQAGERLLLATDGITEAEDNAGSQFGDVGLKTIACYENIDSILDYIIKYQSRKGISDDCTSVEIRFMNDIPSETA